MVFKCKSRFTSKTLFEAPQTKHLTSADINLWQIYYRKVPLQYQIKKKFNSRDQRMMKKF